MKLGVCLEGWFGDFLEQEAEESRDRDGVYMLGLNTPKIRVLAVAYREGTILPSVTRMGTPCVLGRMSQVIRRFVGSTGGGDISESSVGSVIVLSPDDLL